MSAREDWVLKALAVGIAVGVAVGVAASILIMIAVPAVAHEATDLDGNPLGFDWNGWCCSGEDCVPVRDGVISATPEGWRIRIPADQHPMLDRDMDEIVPFDTAPMNGGTLPVTGPRAYPSPIDALCVYPRNTLRCVYVAPRGY